MVEVNDQATADAITKGMSRDGNTISVAYNKLIWKEMSPLGKLKELSHQAGKFFNKNNYANHSDSYYEAITKLSGKATTFKNNSASPKNSSINTVAGNAGKSTPERSASKERSTSMIATFRSSDAGRMSMPSSIMNMGREKSTSRDSKVQGHG
ncbi:MAG: hypothetical protein WBJ81_03510 [Rickettsiales bacterium]